MAYLLLYHSSRPRMRFFYFIISEYNTPPAFSSYFNLNHIEMYYLINCLYINMNYNTLQVYKKKHLTAQWILFAGSYD